MKIFKTTILGLIFLFGLTAMSDSNKVESEQQFKTLNTEIPCSTVFTVCDRAYPFTYYKFAACMAHNGC